MEDWKKESERLKFEDKISWSELYSEMAKHKGFDGLTEKQIEEKVRGYLRRCKQYKEDSPALVFADPHAPFDETNFPYFLRDTAKKHGTKRNINLGDFWDEHMLSKFDPEPCALGTYTEVDLAIQHSRPYYELFPECDVIPGNHDLRIFRKAAKAGIGRRFMKDLKSIMEMPEGWNIHDEEFILNGVLYDHGEGYSGQNGAINKAKLACMSACIGHLHAFGGCQTLNTSHASIFGLNVGCGINEKAYAFAYGKHAKYKPTLGCGVVYSPTEAYFIPMPKSYL